jgi:hypothetical protein
MVPVAGLYPHGTSDFRLVDETLGKDDLRDSQGGYSTLYYLIYCVTVRLQSIDLHEVL